MKNILIDFPVPPELIESVRAIPGVSVRLTPDLYDEPMEKPPREQAPELIRDVHAMLATFPPRNLDAMKNLEVLQINSAGYEHLFGLPLAERGVRVCNGRGIFDVCIAEWNLAMMINLTRNVPGLVRNQDRRIWDRAPSFEGEIFGKTVGIWGYGGTGRHTARLAKAAGMKVHVLTRSGIQQRANIYVPAGAGDPEGNLPDKVFTSSQRDAFLADLDFLILTFPKTPQTTGLVGESELRRLPKRAFLLNPARGPLIVEEALHRALREAWFAGAALDVHHTYPLKADDPLWTMPHVIVTPHIAGVSQRPSYAIKLMDIFAQNMRRFVAGEPLLNELTPAQVSGKA